MIPLLSMFDCDEYIRELCQHMPPDELKNPLLAMCHHKDTHPSAWVEPVSKALPFVAGLSRVSKL